MATTVVFYSVHGNRRLLDAGAPAKPRPDLYLLAFLSKVSVAVELKA